MVQYTCWNQTIPIACRLLCHIEMVCLCPSKSHLPLQTAFIAVFLISDTHIFISLIKFKDSRIHQGMLLYPRRRNQGKVMAAYAQIPSFFLCCAALNSTALISPVSVYAWVCCTLSLLALALLPRTVSWKPPEIHPASGERGPVVKKRRMSSPGPIIVIKDEPDDDGSYVRRQYIFIIAQLLF